MAEWLILQLPHDADGPCVWMPAGSQGHALSAPETSTLAQAGPQLDQVRYVAFIDVGVVRNAAFRLDHMLGNAAAQALQLLPRARLTQVEGREFLRFATNAGWFSVHYTHDCSSETLVGETRTWIISKKTSKAESDPDTLQASKDYPPGPEIRLRVDPREPSRSVPDSAPSRPQPGGTT